MTQDHAAADAVSEPHEMALRALDTAERFLAAVEQETPHLVALLRQGKVEEASGNLGFLLDGLGSLTRLAVDLENVGDPDRGRRLDLGRMARSLRDLVAHQEGCEWSRLADLLESEIAPQLRTWRELFKIQIERLRS